MPFTMLSLVAIIIIITDQLFFSIKIYFSSTEIHYENGMVLLLVPLVVSLELGFILLWEIVFGVVLVAYGNFRITAAIIFKI
jgi:hypothetical protein